MFNLSKEKKAKYIKEAKIIIVLLIIAFTLKSSILEIYVVPTGSMENEILIGDMMIGNKFTYGMRTPNWIGIPYTRMGLYIPFHRLPSFKIINNFDVIMFEYPRDPFQKYVKRCIGISADTISIDQGDIFVNHNLLDFPENAKYAKKSDFNSTDLNSSRAAKWKYGMFERQGKATTIPGKGIIMNRDYLQNPFDEVLNPSYPIEPNMYQQYMFSQNIYPYFNGNIDNIDEFIVPHKGMVIDFEIWYEKHQEWISLITLLVQEGNEVILGNVKYIMEDPKEIARMSGMLWYKLFPNDEKMVLNRDNKERSLSLLNKAQRVDNPWNIYESPFIYDQLPLNEKDLNNDRIFNEKDLINEVIYNEFLKTHNINEIMDIINHKYGSCNYIDGTCDCFEEKHIGYAFLYGLIEYKQFVDKFIKENLRINGIKIQDMHTYTLLHDYYFFMGDNRDNSYDSRNWGFVPDYHILGTPLLSLINVVKFKPRFKTIK